MIIVLIDIIVFFFFVLVEVIVLFGFLGNDDGMFHGLIDLLLVWRIIGLMMNKVGHIYKELVNRSPF